MPGELEVHSGLSLFFKRNHSPRKGPLAVASGRGQCNQTYLVLYPSNVVFLHLSSSASFLCFRIFHWYMPINNC